MKIADLVRNPVKKMSALQWGSTDYDHSYLILKWGENPYSPPKAVLDAIVDSATSLNKYPQLKGTLINKLSTYIGLGETQICLVNGVDKALRLIAEIFVNPGDEVITFAPTFPILGEAVNMIGGKLIQVPLEENFNIPSLIDLNKYFTGKTKLVYICNPNNPTGNFMATFDQIEELLQQDFIVVVDEVYFEFSGNTVIKLLKKYNNLIILRSFSKTFGLAGLRIGYIVSSAEIIIFLKRVEDSIEVFNVSTPSLAGAIAALDNYSKITSNIETINKTKGLLVQKLAKLKIDSYPSYTSFLLYNLKRTGIIVSNFIKKMADEKIILKDMSRFSNLSEYDGYMAIPREDQLERVINSISKVVKIS